MEAGTRTKVQVKTTQEEGSSSKGKTPQKSNYRAQMHKAMKRSSPPKDDPDQLGGGNDDNNIYHDASPPTTTTGLEGKILGNLPSPFTEDRSKANKFLTNMKAYFRLNVKNTQICSPMTRIVMCLSNMDGPEIEEWKCDIRDWFDTLQLDNNDRQGIWITFKEEFTDRFQDSQKVNQSSSRAPGTQDDLAPYRPVYLKLRENGTPSRIQPCKSRNNALLHGRTP